MVVVDGLFATGIEQLVLNAPLDGVGACPPGQTWERAAQLC